jgi:hypothetical protein
LAIFVVVAIGALLQAIAEVAVSLKLPKKTEWEREGGNGDTETSTH